MLAPMPVYAASRVLYWVGADGNWNDTSHWSLSSGGAGGETVPDSDDDVNFDANSGFDPTHYQVAVNTTAYCRDMDWNGVSLANSPQLTFSSYDLYCYGDVRFGSGVRFSTGSKDFYLMGTGSQTITCNGALGYPNFTTNASGTWTQQDSFPSLVTGNLDVHDGTWDFNDQDGSLTSVTVSGGTIDLSTSEIDVTYSWTYTSGTVTCGTSNITIGGSGTTSSFAGGGQTYYDVTVLNTMDYDDQEATITGANTFHDLTLTCGAVTAAQTTLSANQTVTGTLTTTGSAANYRLLVSSSTLHTARTITAATVASTYTDFRDITGAGAGSWDLSAGTAGDCGGNTDITFPSSRTVYFSTATGNLDFSYNKWSNTSGGSPSLTYFPRPQDTAVFDENSFAVPGVALGLDTLSLPSIDTTDVTNNPTFQHYSGTQTMAYIYGSLELGTCTWDVDTTYMYGQGAETISGTLGGGGDLIIDAYTGSVTLSDDLALTTGSGDLTLLSGILYLDDYDVTCGTFISSTTTYQRSLVMTDSIFTLNATGAVTKWNVAATNLAITQGTSEIVFTNTTTNTQTFAGAGFTYNDFTIEGSGNYQTTISGTNTFNDIYVDRSQAAKTLAGNVTCTISHLYSPVAGTTQFTITNTDFTKTSGLVALKYMTISGSTASGGATFLAGAAPPSVDGGSNSGWTFSDYTAPTVVTEAVSSISGTSANFNGNVGSLGSFSGETIYGYFEYGLTDGYGSDTSDLQESITATGDYYNTVTGLSNETGYHVRAVLLYNGHEYAYGADVEFTSAGSPVVTTGDATNITTNSARLQGVLTSLGIYDTAFVYFNYGLTSGSLNNSTPPVEYDAPGAFYADISGLQPYETYYFEAEALYSAASLSTGEENSFDLQAEGVSTTITIVRVGMFGNYLVDYDPADPDTTDYLLIAEIYNKYTDYYPNEEAPKWFTLELLDTDDTTVLGASPLSNWGDRPTAIYFNSTQAANLTESSAYNVRVVGYNIAGVPESDHYTLATTDWKGHDSDSLDNWCTASAFNMQNTDERTDYLTTITDVKNLVITDNAGAYFTTGIPGISQVRPNLFETARSKPQFDAGAASSDYDAADWNTYVGSTIATDATAIGGVFNTDGRTALAWIFGLAMLILTVLGIALGGKGIYVMLLNLPILMYGNYLRVIDIQWTIVMALIMMFFFIRQLWWKTT